MKLLTKAIEKSLPALYSTEDIKLQDKMIQVKYFDPCGAYTLYVIEGGYSDSGDYIFWGWATFGDPDCAEFGYASLKEITSIVNRFGLGIERDLYFEPKKVSEIPAIMKTIRM